MQIKQIEKVTSTDPEKVCSRSLKRKLEFLRMLWRNRKRNYLCTVFCIVKCWRNFVTKNDHRLLSVIVTVPSEKNFFSKVNKSLSINVWRLFFPNIQKYNVNVRKTCIACACMHASLLISEWSKLNFHKG